MSTAPLIIEGEFRLIFNEPHGQGCISIECGSGGLSKFLDDQELERLSRRLWHAALRIRANRSTPTT